MPPGCAFSPRCAFATPACDVGTPPNVEIAPGHTAACLVPR
jgi:oligopeptide/dipeptide ABC transporter ATP-binding protein